MSRMNSTNRRDFLRHSAAAGAAVTSGLTIARGAYAAGSDTLRLAVIGSGGRGTGAAADCLNVAKNVKLVVIADAFEDRARSSRKLLQQYLGNQVAVPDGASSSASMPTRRRWPATWIW